MNNQTLAFYKNRNPSAQNPVYQKTIHTHCHLCFLPGPKKKFVNLWCLYMHYRTHHKDDEKEFKAIVTSLADLIIKGVLF